MVTFLTFKCITCKDDFDSSEGEYDSRICYDCIEDLWDKHYAAMQVREQEAK